MPQNKDQTKALPEICTDYFSFIIQLRITRQYGTLGSLRQKFKLILDAIDFAAKKSDVTPKNLEDAKYAMCALLDQMILTSDCPFKDEWAARPLELEFFGQNIAGVEFFNRLESMRSQIESRGDAAEVYYYCLVNGFEGKYHIEGKEKLNLLIDSLAFDLKRLRQGAFDKLSVQWELPQSLMQKAVTEIPPWLIGVAALFIIFLVFIIFRSIIGSQSAKLTGELIGAFSSL